MRSIIDYDINFTYYISCTLYVFSLIHIALHETKSIMLKPRKI